MFTRTTLLLASACALLASVSALAAQTPAQDSALVHGPRHVISLAMGMLPHLNVSSSGVDANGVLGGLSYQYWPNGEWSIEVSASTHGAAAHAWETHGITSLLFGANWYPRQVAAPTIRPYATFALGTYTASETRASAVRTQSVLGSRLGGGVDAFPARWFRLGVRAAYHLASDYAQPVDGLDSASGPELSLQAGIVVGRR